MAGRLGNVLYWTATGIAIVLATFGLLVVPYSGLLGAGTFWIVATIAWPIGRACRYVFAGR